MASRSIASGTVSFGLVAIPVKLYSPIESSQTIRFNQIHEQCGSRVRQHLFCPVCEREVGRDEIVKGYEFAKGQYALFSEDELKELVVEATHSIDIKEFIPLEEVDPIYFERSYYLGPDRGGEKPYRLLARSLRETSRAALGQYAARGKEYLVLLRPFEDGLIMQQLHYADEIRPFDIEMGDAQLDDAELSLAKQLVEQRTADEFQPDKFEDRVRNQMAELIAKKVEGKEISAAPEAAPRAQVIDLMEALKASLAEGEEGDRQERKPPKKAVQAEKRKRAAGGTKAK